MLPIGKQLREADPTSIDEQAVTSPINVCGGCECDEVQLFFRPHRFMVHGEIISNS